jgi:hypothetical protein
MVAVAKFWQTYGKPLAQARSLPLCHTPVGGRQWQTFERHVARSGKLDHGIP